MAVVTKKFSEFATANLATTSNMVVGVGGGANFKAAKVTTWTTSARPSPPFNGLLGFNTDLESYEYYSTVLVDWIQLEDSGDVNEIFTILASHSIGDGASRIGLQNQSNVISKTVQNLANEVFIVGSAPSSLQNAQLLTAGTGITLTPGVGTMTVSTTGGGSINTGTINQIAYYAAAGTVLSGVGPLTNGQLFIGSTGAAPVAANLTAGPGVSIANAAGAITISGTGSGIGWTEVTGTTQSMAADSGYVANNGALVTLTLPLIAAFGTAISVVGEGAGGWLMAQNAGQSIHIGSVTSTVGTGGSIASTNRRDSINLICVVANTTWTTLGAPQSDGLTIV